MEIESVCIVGIFRCNNVQQQILFFFLPFQSIQTTHVTDTQKLHTRKVRYKHFSRARYTEIPSLGILRNRMNGLFSHFSFLFILIWPDMNSELCSVTYQNTVAASDVSCSIAVHLVIFTSDEIQNIGRTLQNILVPPYCIVTMCFG